MYILNKMFPQQFKKMIFLFFHYFILKFLKFWKIFNNQYLLQHFLYNLSLCYNHTYNFVWPISVNCWEQINCLRHIWENEMIILFTKMHRYIKWDLNLLVYSDKLSNNSLILIWTEKLKQFFINPTNLCYNEWII